MCGVCMYLNGVCDGYLTFTGASVESVSLGKYVVWCVTGLCGGECCGMQCVTEGVCVHVASVGL